MDILQASSKESVLPTTVTFFFFLGFFWKMKMNISGWIVITMFHYTLTGRGATCNCTKMPSKTDHIAYFYSTFIFLQDAKVQLFTHDANIY